MLFTNANVVTLANSDEFGMISGGSVAVEDGKILWAGPSHQIPESYQNLPTTNLGGRLLTPALIDCHTHVVFGGNRAREFEMRLQGASYEELARAGGGIVSTVAATREQTEGI